jgi:hypothetical protein
VSDFVTMAILLGAFVGLFGLIVLCDLVRR